VALCVEGPAGARKKCPDPEKAWDKAFAAAKGTFQEKVESAALAAIKDCGLCYYKTCKGGNDAKIPSNAPLVYPK
jgi:hypothetical protein